MAIINKRIFDTDNALKGSFNGWWGKWQIITYIFFVLGYAIVIGWINRLPDYTCKLISLYSKFKIQFCYFLNYN
jgi:hypothetical protein